MVAVIYSILWIIAAIKLGDWRNWKLYYPTMLFASVGNMLYEIVCSEYPMWAMEKNGLPNHTIPILLLCIIGMPLSTFVYLSNFPNTLSNGRKFFYLTLFVFIFVVLEYISVQLGSITYHNGWNLLWSILFNFVMFSILIIHYRKPIKALFLSSIFVVMLAIIFDVDFGNMK
ncbi:CBO0543 family protein [Neobacillus sp. NRS-1170]|uniref:CBO0543 family protein n=1 Tax=Neobacillus sp. NRS-1170 TaxID=3233898 RepID=UPI003D2B8490